MWQVHWTSFCTDSLRASPLQSGNCGYKPDLNPNVQIPCPPKGWKWGARSILEKGYNILQGHPPIMSNPTKEIATPCPPSLWIQSSLLTLRHLFYFQRSCQHSCLGAHTKICWVVWMSPGGKRKGKKRLWSFFGKAQRKMNERTNGKNIMNKITPRQNNEAPTMMLKRNFDGTWELTSDSFRQFLDYLSNPLQHDIIFQSFLSIHTSNNPSSSMVRPQKTLSGSSTILLACSKRFDLQTLLYFKLLIIFYFLCVTLRLDCGAICPPHEMLRRVIRFHVSTAFCTSCFSSSLFLILIASCLSHHIGDFIFLPANLCGSGISQVISYFPPLLSSQNCPPTNPRASGISHLAIALLSYLSLKWSLLSLRYFEDTFTSIFEPFHLCFNQPNLPLSILGWPHDRSLHVSAHLVDILLQLKWSELVVERMVD
ncbi:hypothetical protein VP01_2853g1 [Puccinia sorghi]|uniref:Uncharacterized protein n=1 Tax=Puccinia sorghi TaxID=27349 RepID=A0A0L6V3S4_9BASI|nr:hypothetical protein VP01_2853g1 [Puccinia sorghi]